MEKFTFIKLDDGNYRLVQINGFSKVIDIPSEHCGKLVTEIDEGVFCEENAKTVIINIPSTIEKIDNIEFCFEDWNNLKSINVEGNNSNFKSIDGVLFNKNCDLLLKYPQNKDIESYNLPITVKEICNEAFMNNRFIQKISLHSPLETIGEAAFAKCENLKEIVFPETLLKIKDEAFVDCISLENIVIPSKLKSNIDAGTFQACSSLSSIVVDGNNKKYGSMSGVLYNKKNGKLLVYPNNKSDSEFEIPNIITTLSKACFASNKYLKKIYIPSTVSKIEDMVFDNMKKLEYIEVDSENAYFSSKDGVLYNKEETVLLRCPMSKEINEFYVPNSVERIGEAAFADCLFIQKISLSKSLTSIEDFAINQMPKLKEIEAPCSLEYIGFGNFEGCPQLETKLKPTTSDFENEDFFDGE